MMIRPRQLFCIAVAAITYLLLDAQEAYAWGPATHVHIAHDVLRSLTFLPAAVAGILSRYTLDFIYGCVAADVVVAKRLSRVKQFCHHWSTGFTLLDRSRNDRQRAFAFGYLSHLAADTVAHGKYVPRQILLTGSTLNFGHLYWEMRADRMASNESIGVVRAFPRYDFDAHHRSMAGLLSETFLPYAMNRGVFERVNAVTSGGGWQAGLQLVDRWSRWPLSEMLIDAYRGECVSRTLDLLREGAQSVLLRDDPNGTTALAYSRVNRRQWRRMELQGDSLRQRVNELAAAWAPETGAESIVVAKAS